MSCWAEGTQLGEDSMVSVSDPTHPHPSARHPWAAHDLPASTLAPPCGYHLKFLVVLQQVGCGFNILLTPSLALHKTVKSVSQGEDVKQEREVLT